MPMPNFYYVWIDPVFYLWGAAFVLALFTLVYSMRKYMELDNAGVFDDEESQEEAPLPAPEPSIEQPEFLAVEPEPALPDTPPAAEPAPMPSSAPSEASISGDRAETFVRGIYEGISSLDSRLKALEASLSGRGDDSAVKFLEDILQDLDSLDNAKIRARIEYLVADLKKRR